MLINLTESLSYPDRILHMKADISFNCFSLHGEEYLVEKKEPVNFVITNLGKKRILIQANSNLTLQIPCSRCLDNVSVNFVIDFTKELDFDKSNEERAEELDETNYIDEYNLDVDLLVYDEILIDFPMKVLCKEDCKGICNVCGQNLNEGDCNCESTSLDPRMSVIRDIFNNHKN